MSKNSNMPLLSIAIPTKNRYEYLIPCVETLLRLKSKYTTELEIIIQDNNWDNNNFLPFLNEHKDSIKYYHIPEHLSVVENCDYAISNCSGEYVCLLGDDDSVTSQIIDVCKWMKEKGIESCLGKICRFNWPDMVYTVHKFKKLTIPRRNKNIGFKDVAKIRKRILATGGYTMLTLPRVYHAILSKKALDKLKDLCGSYFPGPSPDMANAIGLTYVLNNHIIIDTPIIVSGFSYKSTGGAGTRRAHVGKIEDIAHLPKQTKTIWDSRIPRYWTGETIYAESIIEALTKCNSKDIKQYSFNALYGTFAMYHRDLIPLLRGYVNYKNILRVSYHFCRILAKRTLNFFKNVGETRMNLTSNTTYDNITSLQDAVKTVDSWCEQENNYYSHRKLI